MSKKNPILSKAEVYETAAPKQTRPDLGDKAGPYTFPVARDRVARRLRATLAVANTLSENMTPDDQIVTSLTLHPSFLAKTYYPKDILAKYSLKNLGSKEVIINPEVSVTDEQRAGNISSSLFFVSGKKENFNQLLSDLLSNHMDESSKDDLVKIEDLVLFDAEEKLAPSSKLQAENTELCYEVVLHASPNDHSVLTGFFDYIEFLQGHCFKDKTRSVDALTFCFLKINTNKIRELAKFSFVRVVRPLAEIKLADRMITLDARNEVHVEGARNINPNLAKANIAVFDAGLFPESNENAHIRYFDLTGQPTDAVHSYVHGSRVTSALVYGEAEDYISASNVVLPVDHYKVYSGADEFDIGLVDVLDRIQSVLQSTHYRFVNISLGPEYPCSDEEPSLWTSTLDRLAEEGGTLIVVAVGNAGMAGEGFSRIQPPSDLLNGLSIGAANSKGDEWHKASYSNIGPGRRPGYIKPDALYFGGEIGEGNPKIQLITLNSFELEEVYGTSFAAPLVTRQAALIDYFTEGQLNIATIRALLIHSTSKHDLERKDCGWGRIDSDIENILFCSDRKVTFIYQGELKTATGIRAAVPCPKALEAFNGMANISATLCFYAEVDPQHTVSYTKAGVEIQFRPHSEKFHYDKEKEAYAKEPETRTLFNRKNILGTEQTLRKDSHKWETCYKVYDRMRTSSLNEPIFDIRYRTRDEGHQLTQKEMQNLKPLKYSMIVTVELEKEFDLYASILSEYTLLQPITINIDAAVAGLGSE